MCDIDVGAIGLAMFVGLGLGIFIVERLDAWARRRKRDWRDLGPPGAGGRR